MDGGHLAHIRRVVDEFGLKQEIMEAMTLGDRSIILVVSDTMPGKVPVRSLGPARFDEAGWAVTLYSSDAI